MLLGLQKKLSYMLGELHEGIVDVGTVAEAILDKEFLASMNISRSKKDAFLEVLEEVIKDTSFEFRGSGSQLGECETCISEEESPIRNADELQMWVRNLRKGIQTAKDPVAYAVTIDPVIRVILSCCTQADTHFRGNASVMREHAGIYSAHIIGALLES